MANDIPAWVNGILTPVDKLAVHRQGLRHKAVSVFVLRGRQLLLQQRAAGKYHSPLLWANTCCTHPHWNEPPETCASRRLAQELGITRLALRPAGQVEYRADVGNGMIEHELVDIFLADAPAELAMALNPEEVEATAWVDLDDLVNDITARPARYTAWVRIYLQQHRATIFGA